MALRVFLLLAVLFLLLTGREPPWADAHVVYDTTQALVHRGELSVTLDGHPWFFAVRGGRKYGVFPLGNVLAMVPSYVAFLGLRATGLFPRQPLFAFASHLSPALLMALCGALFYRLLRRSEAPPRAALGLTLVLAFSTLCLVYARSPYSEALQTALLLWLVAATLDQSQRLRTFGMISLGAAAGCLFNAKLVNALLLPVPLAYLVYQHIYSPRQQGARVDWRGVLGGALAGLLAFLPFVALALWHNRLKTGSLWDSGYRMQEGLFSGDLWPGIYGFLFSTGKGMFFYSPPLLLGVLGLPTAWRRRPAETALLCGLMAVTLLFNSKFRIWHADYCWGPRHLTSLCPLLLLLCWPWLPEALARGRRRLRVLALWSLVAAGVVVQVLGASVYWDHYIRVLIAVKDQTGAAGWFHESLSHGHYIPQFSPIRGHLWLLSHLVRRDPDLAADVPWRLIVPQKVELRERWSALRGDLWALEFLAVYPPASGPPRVVAAPPRTATPAAPDMAKTPAPPIGPPRPALAPRQALAPRPVPIPVLPPRESRLSGAASVAVLGGALWGAALVLVLSLRRRLRREEG